MSVRESSLAVKILEELYGKTVSKVADNLLKNGSSNRRSLMEFSHLTMPEIKKALCVLIQHHMAEFETAIDRTVHYNVLCKHVLYRPRFPKFILMVKSLYGDSGELIIEEFLLKGELPMSVVVNSVLNRLQADSESDNTSLAEVKSTFSLLVATHFLHRCMIVRSTSQTQTPVLSIEACDKFVIPEIEINMVAGIKRKANEDLNQGIKKVKYSEDAKDVVQQEGALWYVNFERFDQLCRDQIICGGVEKRYGSMTADIVRAHLRVSELTTQYKMPMTVPASVHLIQESLPDSSVPVESVVHHLSNLADETSWPIVSRTGDEGGGQYTVNVKSTLKLLTQITLENIVQERFGSKSARIFRLILERHLVEQRTVESVVMVPHKEAKELLYGMFTLGYVHTKEVARTTDHAPGRTSYFFTVDLPRLVRMVIDDCYKAMSNIIDRRLREQTDNRRLLDQEQKIEGIIEQLMETGGAEDQIQEIRDYMTPVEKQQLELLKKVFNVLEKAELQLTENISLFTIFLDSQRS